MFYDILITVSFVFIIGIALIIRYNDKNERKYRIEQIEKLKEEIFKKDKENDKEDKVNVD